MVNPIRPDALGSVSTTDQTKKPETLSDAAKEFEALFLQTVLKQMRSASDVLAPEDSPLSSNKQSAFRDMHDQTVAQSLASKGQLGIARMVEQQLTSEGRAEARDSLSRVSNMDQQLSVSLTRPPIDTSEL